MPLSNWDCFMPRIECQLNNQARGPRRRAGGSARAAPTVSRSAGLRPRAALRRAAPAGGGGGGRRGRGEGDLAAQEDVGVVVELDGARRGREVRREPEGLRVPRPPRGLVLRGSRVERQRRERVLAVDGEIDVPGGHGRAGRWPDVGIRERGPSDVVRPLVRLEREAHVVRVQPPHVALRALHGDLVQ
eukprot:gene5134-biopygen12186